MTITKVLIFRICVYGTLPETYLGWLNEESWELGSIECDEPRYCEHFPRLKCCSYTWKMMATPNLAVYLQRHDLAKFLSPFCSRNSSSKSSGRGDRCTTNIAWPCFVSGIHAMNKVCTFVKLCEKLPPGQGRGNTTMAENGKCMNHKGSFGR